MTASCVGADGEPYNPVLLMAPAIVILIFTTLLLPTRLYASTLRPHGRGHDEFLLPAGWMLVVASCALVFVMLDQGSIGCSFESVFSLGVSKVVGIVSFNGMYMWIILFLSQSCNYFTRLSIVILYLRVFPTGKVRVFSWGILAFLTIFIIAHIITAAVLCVPMQAVWDISVTDARCFEEFPRIALFKAFCIINIAIDVAIMITPLPTVWSLQCSKLRKVGIAVTFASGGIGLFASCARSVYYFRWSSSKTVFEIWVNILPFIIWTVVESGMYLSAACFIGMRPILPLLGNWFKTRSSWLHTWYRGIYYDEESGSKPKSDISS